MSRKGNFPKNRNKSEIRGQQNSLSADSQNALPLLPSGSPSAPSSTSEGGEEQVVILMPRPAEERAGIFLKDWMRRFSRM